MTIHDSFSVYLAADGFSPDLLPSCHRQNLQIFLPICQQGDTGRNVVRIWGAASEMVSTWSFWIADRGDYKGHINSVLLSY